jgi:Zn-dependent protease with chaperone function
MKPTTLTILFFILLFSSPLFSKNQTRDLNKEQKIESELQIINPNLVSIFKKATLAMDQNNYPLSDSLFRIVYREAPAFDPAIRRLGMLQLYFGKVDEALEFCEKAVIINKSAYNLLSLAYCYFNPGTKQDLSKALGLLNEAKLLPNGDDEDIEVMMAQIALKQNNIPDFRTSTNLLLQKHPDVMATHYFAAILATQDEDWPTAKNQILQAKNMGLSEDLVQKFLDSGVNSSLRKRQYGTTFLWIVGVWLTGLFLLFLIGKLLSNITLRSIEKLAQSAVPNASTKILRPIYRLFMNVGGIYYYLSLPIIIVLVLGLVVGLFYLFLYIGHIPIQIMAVLAIGSCFTIYSMIRSLFVKIDYSDPGRKLTQEEAPGLFKLAEEVASAIGTRPIDEIRLTPTTELAVYERGSWKDKFQDNAKRVLILGVGILKDFNQTDFRAVLAHEYGHFSHRDTAGGDVALRVRNDMTKYFYALYQAGQNVWWNLAFQFLRLYHFIFRRISHGSTRLQEVLADTIAAKTYGKVAFQNGLIYVIKRDIEFNFLANLEIEDAKKSKRSFHNLYELSGSLTSSAEEELEKSLSRTTTEDDTHPSPSDRFRFISNIQASTIHEDSSKIKELFLNWDTLTEEMTSQIEEQINRNR